MLRLCHFVCRFSRLIVAQSNRDLTLNMPLFQIYGMSTNGGEDKIGLNNLIKLYK